LAVSYWLSMRRLFQACRPSKAERQKPTAKSQLPTANSQ
jgi:hypothetical protein